MQGYKELRESAAWVDLSARGKIRMTGEDRVRLLHAMCTNHIEELKPGDGCYAFFLSAQGRILADINVLCFEDHLLLDTEPETRQRVFDHLDQFIIADDVTLEDATASLATIAIKGPKLPITGPNQQQHWTALGDNVVLRIDPDTLYIFTPDKAAFVATLNVPEADAEAYRTIRIEQGIPRYGEEITERFLVQETGQMRAMNFSKGCYLGQEIVERVRSRGQVHRHLMTVRIDTQEVPATGAKLTSGEKELGEIVSAAHSPALQKIVAMAYLRTDAATPGFKLTLGEASAEVGS